MDEEIILNLWYVYDDLGVIYSLRIKPYVMKGSDEEKLLFLKERAKFDYLVANSFPIPDKFKINYNKEILDVASVAIMRTGFEMGLFEEAIKKTEENLPMQTKLIIPESPLVVITPLFADKNYNLKPVTEGSYKLS